MRNSKVTRGGQVSLPAYIRHRWKTRAVRIEDHGDHVALYPAPDDPIAAAKGAFAARLGASSKQLRREARAEERAAEERRG